MQDDQQTLERATSVVPVGKRLGVVSVVGLLLAGGLSLLLAGAALGTREPGWWAKSAPVGDVRTLGSSAEHRVIAEASRVRSRFGSQWEVSLTQDECNAWLMQRFPEWIASFADSAAEVDDSNATLSEDVRQPEVRISCQGDEPVIGVRDEGGRIVWAKLLSSDDELSVHQFGVGSIGVPTAIARHNKHVVRLERIIARATRDVVCLPDGRRVRIVGVRSDAGAVKLTGMTLGAE